MKSVKDICWLAGLLEGEGSFGVTTRRTGLRIQLTMTDRDVVQRAADILGANLLGPYKTPAGNWSRFFTGVQGPLAAQWMMTLLSLMGQRRRRRITECLEAWKRGLTNGQAACHPDKKLLSNGLCRKCYYESTGGRERNNAIKLRWQSENKDRINAATRQWRSEHPEFVAAENAKRRKRLADRKAGILVPI